jgi:hypothetical protein
MVVLVAKYNRTTGMCQTRVALVSNSQKNILRYSRFAELRNQNDLEKGYPEASHISGDGKSDSLLLQAADRSLLFERKSTNGSNLGRRRIKCGLATSSYWYIMPTE